MQTQEISDIVRSASAGLSRRDLLKGLAASTLVPILLHPSPAYAAYEGPTKTYKETNGQEVTVPDLSGKVFILVDKSRSRAKDSEVVYNQKDNGQFELEVAREIELRPDIPKGAIAVKATPRYDKKSGDYIVEGQIRIFDTNYRLGELWVDLTPSWSRIKTDEKSKKVLIELYTTYGRVGSLIYTFREK